MDYFCKLRLQLHISDSEEVIILKFNSSLLFQFYREVELFESTTAPPNAQWYSFHKTQSHSYVDCRSLKSFHTNKTLFIEATTSQPMEDIEIVPLDNPTEVDPSLILMTSDHTKTPSHLFSHNFQVRQSLALMVMDNGSQKNLISQDLVHKLKLPTTPHPNPYQLR